MPPGCARCSRSPKPSSKSAVNTAAMSEHPHDTRIAMESVSRLGVVGCGLMGSGIAEVAALRGLDVLVAEATPQGVAEGRRRVTGSLRRGADRGKLTEEQLTAALGRISFTHDLEGL